MSITEKPTKAAGYTLKAGDGVSETWFPYVAGPVSARHTNKVTGVESEGRLFQAILSYPRGSAAPIHIHHDADETFYVTDGEVTIFVGEEQVECGPGDFAFGPRGVPHTFLVTSEMAQMLLTFSPAGIEGFFGQVGLPVIAGEPAPQPTEPDQDEFVRLMAKYGCEFVAPPPTLD